MTPDEFKRRRIRLRMSFSQLAERLGVDRRTVVRWENGDRKIPEMAARLTASFTPLPKQEGRAGTRRPKKKK